jgi:hypothetical protein
MKVTKMDVDDAIAAADPKDTGEAAILVLRHGDGRRLAHRPAAGDGGQLILSYVGEVDLAAMGGRPPAIRPGGDQIGDPSNPNTPDLDWLRPEDRERIKAERAAMRQATRPEVTAGATSAAHGAHGLDPRPSASAGASNAHTRPESGAGSVRGI